MKPLTLIDSAPVPEGKGELKLFKHDEDFSIRVGFEELMNSRGHGSEDALAEVTINRIQTKRPKRILIGGLGMGFTLAKALDVLGPKDRIDIAELSPHIVDWNREYFTGFNGNPLEDKRVNLIVGDVLTVMKSNQRSYEAILLDVDNGPDGLTKDDNNRIYSRNGLKAAFQALRSGGILAVWSAGESEVFTERLKKSNFLVDKWWVRERSNGKGAKHLIWLATKRR